MRKLKSILLKFILKKKMLKYTDKSKTEIEESLKDIDTCFICKSYSKDNKCLNKKSINYMKSLNRWTEKCNSYDYSLETFRDVLFFKGN